MKFKVMTARDLLSSWNRPEYLLHPRAILRRMVGRKASDGIRVVRLRWGLPLRVDPRESIGWGIACCGLIDISVIEAILRLTDPTDIFLDVGANIGLMSSAALAAGARRVIALEPNPEVFAQLSENVSLWDLASPKTAGRVSLLQQAVSDKSATASLRIPKRNYRGNHGLASLEAVGDEEGFTTVEVPTITLAQIVESNGTIGVLKIDIEGHELTAFAGSREMLSRGEVRDILFEDHEEGHSELRSLLAESGYTIFGLNQTPFAFNLLSASQLRHYPRKTTNFLATRAAERACHRISGRGFRCLSSRFASTRN